MADRPGRPVTTGRSAPPLMVRLSPEERERLQAAADAAGLALSVYVREVALERAQSVTDPADT